MCCEVTLEGGEKESKGEKWVGGWVGWWAGEFEASRVTKDSKMYL